MRFKSLLVRFIAFYLLILLIPVLISGLMYKRSLDVIKQEIDNTNTVVMNKIQLSIDSSIADLNNTVSLFNFDANVTGLIFDRTISERDWLLMYKVKESLSSVSASNRFISSINLYFRNSDIVLTPSCSFSGDDYFTSASDALYHDRSWYGSRVQFSYLDTGKPALSDNIFTLAYFRTLPYDEIGGSQAIIVIYLDPVMIRETLAGSAGVDYGTFFMVDSQGQSFFPDSASAFDTGDMMGRLSDRPGVQYMQVNGEPMAVSQSYSDDFDLRYLSVMPSKIYNSRIDSIRNLYLLSLAGCCLLGGLLAIYFARLNYNPIKDIVANIADKPGAFRQSFNEYDIIRESIRHIIAENDDARKTANIQKNALRSSFVTSLIKGSNNDGEYIRQGLDFFGIRFEHACFIVLILSLDRTAKVRFDYDKSAMIRLSDKQFRPLGQSVWAETADGAIGLVNVEDADCVPELMRQARCLIDHCRQSDGVSITMAVSGVCPSLDRIGEAYREAEYAMEYRMLAGSGSILNYGVISAPDTEGCWGHASMNEQQKLANSLKSGEMDMARDILRNLIQDEFYSRTISIPMAKCKMFGLIDVMITTMEEMAPDSDTGSPMNKTDCVEAMLACKTISELSAVMEDIIDRIEAHVRTLKDSKCEQMKNDVLDYIAGHCYEQDFCVSRVADHFGFSNDGISRFFKKAMNTGLLSYINQQRIDRAVALMKQEDVTIKLVADSVGFSNTDSFIRVFKKVKGTTPGKYRNMIGE